MPLICVVSVEMARPGTPAANLARWREQRDHDEPLSPDPRGDVRTWRGDPDARDFDRLIAFKERDGWQLVSNRRQFIDHKEDVQDEVKL